MIDAKNKFREGYVLIKVPFSFYEMDNPIQQHTIVWAYTEQPFLKRSIKTKSLEQIQDIIDTPNIKVPFGLDPESWKSQQIEKIYDTESSFEQIVEGDIIQATIDGCTFRLYPDEYQILSAEKLGELLSEEGYHAVCSSGLLKVKTFIEATDYLKSRGISKRIAQKWATLGYKDLAYYKPYYDLLKMFTRPEHIYIDTFYENVEGISLKEQKKYANAYTIKNKFHERIRRIKAST